MIYCGGHGRSPQACIYLVVLNHPATAILYYNKKSLAGLVLMLHHNACDTFSNLQYLCPPVHTHTHTNTRRLSPLPAHQARWEPWLKFPPCSASVGGMANDVCPHTEGALLWIHACTDTLTHTVRLSERENSPNKNAPPPVHWTVESLWKSAFHFRWTGKRKMTFVFSMYGWGQKGITVG